MSHEEIMESFKSKCKDVKLNIDDAIKIKDSFKNIILRKEEAPTD